jgi:hypothetical protein
MNRSNPYEVCRTRGPLESPWYASTRVGAGSPEESDLAGSGTQEGDGGSARGQGKSTGMILIELRDRRIDWEAAKTRVLGVLRQQTLRNEPRLTKAEVQAVTHLR